MATTPAWIAAEATPMKPSAASVADRYRDVAAKILAHAAADRGAYTKLAYLTDRIGNRVAGSASLDKAIAWATETMKADGHDAHTEAAMVPHWVRGSAAAEIVTPVARPMSIIALGGSVATPKGGVTAPIVVVHDWAELDAKKDAVKGAIVLYDVAMPPYDKARGSGYGSIVPYRTQGALRAAKYGAVAVLMRSVTAHSLHTLHAGAMRYDDPAVTKIPAGAITVEDSALLARLAATGAVTVHVALDTQTLPDVPSANVIGELKGSTSPDEVVILGAHIDSWDVGQGAHDDGAGCVTMMQALTTLRAMKLAPRRTIRVVLFTNEENGIRGAKQYGIDHTAEFPKMVMAIEADSGGFAPRGFSMEKPDPHSVARLRDIVSLLRPIGATKITGDGGGADIGQLTGVPQLELITDGKKYFDIHHTDADTLDKVDPAELAADVAAVAVLAFVVADMPGRIAD